MLLIAVIALLVVAVGFSWMVGSALTKPAQRAVVLPASFAGTEVSFPSESGVTLRGNFLRGQNGAGAVILMHGIRGNRGAMARHAEFLHARGHSVLLFDFQAHGESGGGKITSGYLESKDAAAAVRFAREQAPGERIAILGASLGGAAALLAEPPVEVDAMILEMVYPDIDRAVKNRIALVLGNWARVFSPLLTWQLKLRLGAGAEWFSPERAIAHVHCPKLLIAGGADQHTTLADSKALYAAAVEPRELWVVDGARHENLYAATGPEYERRVLGFLEKSLGTVSAGDDGGRLQAVSPGARQ